MTHSGYLPPPTRGCSFRFKNVFSIIFYSILFILCSYQSELMKGCQEQLTNLQSVNEHLTHYIRSLPSPTQKTVSFALPDKFDGSADQCRGFIRQVRIYLDHQGDKFESEEKRCAFLMTLLTSRAIDWAAAVWDSDSRFRTSVDYFFRQLQEVFENPAEGKSVATQLIFHKGVVRQQITPWSSEHSPLKADLMTF